MDVSALLSFASSSDRDQQPSPKNAVSSATPNVELLALSCVSSGYGEACLLAVAWTETGCSAQLLLTSSTATSSSSSTSPTVIWSSMSSSSMQTEDIVCVKIAGGIPASADKSNNWNVAVLVATSNNQVYSIPLVVVVNDGNQQQTLLLLAQPALKVFPDKKFCQDYFQMHACQVNEEKQRLIVQDIRTAEDNSTFIWIIFSSGSAIRLSLEACFPHQPSCQVDNDNNGNVDASETEIIQIHLLFPSSTTSSSSSSSSVNKVVPLPKYHSCASLLLPKDPIYEALSFGDNVSSLTFYTSDESVTGKVAVSVGLSGELIAATGNTTSSSLHSSNSQETTITGNIIVGTKAVVRGVFGSLWKSWGSYSAPDYDITNSYNTTTTSTNSMHNDNDNKEFGHLNPDETKAIIDTSDGASTTAFENKQLTMADNKVSCTSVVHKYLLPQQTLLDPPRKITSVSIDPLGNMAAIADTLGRVMLIDLSTKQIVRMWKGLRDSKCYWIVRHQCTFLVIHARQRSLIEIWKMMYGPRVKKMDLISSENKFPHSYYRIIQCSTLSRNNSDKGISNCYLIDGDGIVSLLDIPLMEANPVGEILSGVDNTYQQSAEREAVPESATRATKASMNGSYGKDGLLAPTASSIRRGPALHLQLLNQLLSEESSAPPTSESIYNAIIQITSTSDLCQALDLVSSSSYLEDGLLVEQLDVTGFYTRIVNLCREKLVAAMDTEQEHLYQLQQVQSTISGINSLRRNIQFHTQIIEAYELIKRFELEMSEEEEGDSDSDIDKMECADSDGGYFGAPRTPWAEEAMSWVRTYEEVTGRCLNSTIDEAALHLSEGIIANKSRHQFLRFSAFFKACRMQSSTYSSLSWTETEKNQRIPIELCDSSKERVVILSHLFRPLLKDIFVFKVVNSIFTSLGVHQNFPLLEQYFGEWFMSLSAMESSRASLYDIWCPILRWLQDMIAASYDAASSKAISNNNALQHLQALCSEASDLPRAFLLAVVCREAVLITSKQWEAKTYGKVSSKASVLPWDRILRKLRLCLVVSLKLKEEERNPFPITVAHVEAGNIFSLFQWVARDQLTLSHKQNELENVEIACRSSRLKLCPSLAECDAPSKWKILQRACKAQKNCTGERASLLFFTEKTDQPGPLLLYLSQFNQPIELAAHRALLLGEKWGKAPTSLHLIKDAVSALRVLQGDHSRYNNIACAVRLEIWQTRIRPIYRALFFGFDEVPELSEDVMFPLVRNLDWLRGLAKIAAEVLSLIERTPTILEEDDHVEIESNCDGDSEGLNSEVEIAWPVVQDDIILRRLVQRTKPVNKHSLDVHKGIICAAHLAEDISSLVQCAPSFGDVFLSSSLFKECSPSCCTNEQILFVRKSVYKKAREFKGPLLNRYDLDEIENLGKAWGFAETRIRSEFILALYLFGKDATVVDFPTDFSNLEEAKYFVFEGLCIVCIRIHATLKIITQVKQFRPILSMLDAETCRWIKDQTENGFLRHEALGWDSSDAFPSLSATHELIFKLLHISSTTGDKSLMEKSQALSLLSATLLKAIQDEQDTS